MKKDALSILIPTYNGDCRQLVGELQSQAEGIAGLDYEIIVADDGSPQRQCVERCAEVGSLPHCRFIAREQNSGRAAIRNFLATEARKEWLLYIDCDLQVCSHSFLETYLNTEGEVIYGGYRVGSGPQSSLRYRYEKACEPLQTADQRRRRPYQHFHTGNFVVRRTLMLAHPFDESFRQYGYEDVLFGRRLQEARVAITHADNPVGFFTFESNASFVSKTEEGLRTLHDKRQLLRGYSQMLTFVEGIHVGAVRAAIRLWHRLFGRLERRWLCSSHPSLRVFKLYKLGYYLTLDHRSPHPKQVKP